MNKIEREYFLALKQAKEHYENFPVISFFVPKKLQKHVAIIYKFARTADDFADEERFKDNDRFKLLDDYQNNLKNAINGLYKNDFWEALANTIREYDLTSQLFIDLLTAFKQDLSQNRYEEFEDILNYCKLSANPVGRIILELNNIKNEDALKYSDDICTALQLANFYQDVSVDLAKNRVYIPLKEINDFNYSLIMLKNKENSEEFAKIMKFQVERAKKLFENGKKLIKLLNGRLKYQIIWTIYGGEMILDKIKENNYNVLYVRPKLTKMDVISIILKSVLK